MAVETRSRTILVAALLAGAFLLGAGVFGLGYLVGTSSNGDPSRAAAESELAPVLVSGVVEQADGTTAEGGRVEIYVWPGDDLEEGEEVPVQLVGETEIGAGGRYVLRVAPSPLLAELAGENGGWINFDGWFFAPGAEYDWTSWGFSRELRNGAWFGDEEDQPLDITLDAR